MDSYKNEEDNQNHLEKNSPHIDLNHEAQEYSQGRRAEKEEKPTCEFEGYKRFFQETKKPAGIGSPNNQDAPVKTEK